MPHAEPLPSDDARQTACILSHLRLPLHALAYGFWFYCGGIHCGRWQALAALMSMACLVVVEGSAMCFRQPTISFTQRVAFAFDLGVLPGLILVTSVRGLILEAMHPWLEGDSLIIGGFGQTFFTGMVPLDFVLAGVLGCVGSWATSPRLIIYVQPPYAVSVALLATMAMLCGPFYR